MNFFLKAKKILSSHLLLDKYAPRALQKNQLLRKVDETPKWQAFRERVRPNIHFGFIQKQSKVFGIQEILEV